MKINSINNQNSNNTPSFKNVYVVKNPISGLMSLKITAGGANKSVKVICGEDLYSLGDSPIAKKLSKILIDNGPEITHPHKSNKVKRLMYKLVCEYIIPELKKERKLKADKLYKISDVLGKNSLDDIKAIARKGEFEYIAENESKGFNKTLLIKLNSNEKIANLIPQKEQKTLGIA